MCDVMARQGSRIIGACVFAAAAAVSACDAHTTSQGPSRSKRYEDLTSLFTEWRTFQKPKLADGVPDYTAGAMAAQQREIAAYQGRLAASEPAGWPVRSRCFAGS